MGTMATDSLSQALAQRRGKGIDPSLVQEINAPHPGIDSRIGVDGVPSAGGEIPGNEGARGPQSGNLPQPDVQHKMVVNENNPPAPNPDWRSQTHVDEHTQVDGESSKMAPQPLSQSHGVGEGELQEQIRQHVIGHQSEGEAEQLAGHRPRSLGERAKMMAMKEKSDKS